MLKCRFLTSEPQNEELVWVVAALLRIHLPARTWEVETTALLGPLQPLGEPGLAAGFWFCPGPSLAVVVIWELDQWMKSLSLCLCIFNPLRLCLPFKINMQNHRKINTSFLKVKHCGFELELRMFFFLFFFLALSQEDNANATGLSITVGEPLIKIISRFAKIVYCYYL